MVMRDGVALVAGGLVAGAGLSLAAVRALQSVTTEVAGVPAALPWAVRRGAGRGGARRIAGASAAGDARAADRGHAQR